LRPKAKRSQLTKQKIKSQNPKIEALHLQKKETNFFLLMKMPDFIFKLSFSYDKEKMCTKNKRLSTSSLKQNLKMPIQRQLKLSLVG
jgi:hypothetical protein